MELGRSRKCAKANASMHSSRQLEENLYPYTVRLLLCNQAGDEPSSDVNTLSSCAFAVVDSSWAMDSLVRSDNQFGDEFTRQGVEIVSVKGRRRAGTQVLIYTMSVATSLWSWNYHVP